MDIEDRLTAIDVKLDMLIVLLESILSENEEPESLERDPLKPL